ncbi:MogA/MoaB family molybdenum cofactor biosynthesis protein [Paenibacillus sediminis]|nr:MogA/MoaB family molybdenum cofactor biosynthesis protein [Paenibacillus sediminis]
MRSVDEHKSVAPSSASCMVITVSDTRTKENDTSGHLMISLLEERGHQVVHYEIIRDDYDEIQRLIKNAAANSHVDTVLLTGGTGISPRDTTWEAVKNLLHKELPGFGELFRYLSFAEDIGPAAMLSRAIAGIHNNIAVFSMPGSKGAVKLAMERLIIPELTHVLRELRKST